MAFAGLERGLGGPTIGDIRQHLGKIEIEGELAAPTRTARARVGQRMADIDRHTQRRTACCGRHPKTGKNESQALPGPPISPEKEKQMAQWLDWAILLAINRD